MAGLSQGRAKVDSLKLKSKAVAACGVIQGDTIPLPGPVGSRVGPTSVPLLLTACVVHWLLCQNITSVPHIPSPVPANIHTALQPPAQWEQGTQHRAGADLLLILGKERSVWDRKQRSSRTGASLPAAPTRNRSRKSKCMCSFLSPLAAFHHCLCLEITYVMLKKNVLQKTNLSYIKQFLHWY